MRVAGDADGRGLPRRGPPRATSELLGLRGLLLLVRGGMELCLALGRRGKWLLLLLLLLLLRLLLLLIVRLLLLGGLLRCWERRLGEGSSAAKGAASGAATAGWSPGVAVGAVGQRRAASRALLLRAGVQRLRWRAAGVDLLLLLILLLILLLL